MPKLAEKLINSFNEMAFNRDKWIDRVRDSYLGGALGEYAKLVIVRTIKKPDNWSNEVKRLLLKINKMLDKKVVKTKTSFNREKALIEAVKEASLFQEQISKAKNDLVRIYQKNKDQIYSIELDSEDLMKDMLEEFFNQNQ
jgi:hypothetical protein